MFSWKKWLIKGGKKIVLVLIVEGGYVISHYIQTTQAELPPDYVSWALLAALVFSQIANIVKHTYLEP
ncbi:MAG: hypothetical protein KAS32_13690 [Candidatus Peribacteraceae bacterium]|nr:hypothetical protein [Candidatus Peribacteraceae bacterium]